ncbi:MAG: deoxyribose-phosphate aldolase [Candidatus Bipolaricaulota bacterium]
MIKKQELASMIDHTLLGPDALLGEVDRLCAEALEHNFYSVCVSPMYTARASANLEDRQVGVVAVIGFPHGTNATGAKGFEAQLAIEAGADELDMVPHLSALRSGNYRAFVEDVERVTEVADKSKREVLVKVILEMGLLEKAEKVTGCILAQAAGADLVKTSTGFGYGGATVEDVELMNDTVGEDLGIKAAGGIRSYEDAQAMIEAGATRIGASSGVEIVEGAPE